MFQNPATIARKSRLEQAACDNRKSKLRRLNRPLLRVAVLYLARERLRVRVRDQVHSQVLVGGELVAADVALEGQVTRVPPAVIFHARLGEEAQLAVVALESLHVFVDPPSVQYKAACKTNKTSNDINPAIPPDRPSQLHNSRTHLPLPTGLTHERSTNEQTQPAKQTIQPTKQSNQQTNQTK